jgi:uncharacterized membrane protein YccC
VAVTKTQLDKIETLSRSLFGYVADIKGFAGEALEPSREGSQGGWLNIDQDRVIAAVRVVATLWIAFLVWVYVDPPGHQVFVQLTVTFAMVAAMLGLRASSLLLPYAAGSVFAGVLYILVMPHLSGYTQLGLMIFGATFIVYYLFWEPRQGLAKLGFMVPFVVLTFIENEQSYDFAKYANTTAELLLATLLAAATAYIPTSPRPEKMFLRVLRRFFRYAEFLMSFRALDRKQSGGLLGRWRAALYKNGLLELPPKLAALGDKIDHRAFPDNTREKLQALVTNLFALTLRIKELMDTRASIRKQTCWCESCTMTSAPGASWSRNSSGCGPTTRKRR